MSTADVDETSQAVLDVTLPAVSNSVPRARALLSGFLTPFSGERACDIRLAVTEACANVAQHAYLVGDAGRTLRLAAWSSPGALRVLIEDHGRGLSSRHSTGGLGLGLVLISRLADDARIEGRADGGTLISMTFNRER